MTDLWPDNLVAGQIESPVSIMREQAKLLGNKTSNLVEAEVSAGSSDTERFVYHFYIVAPTLNNYHFLLFTVIHNIDLYPLTIYLDGVLGEELGAELLPESSVAKHLSFQMEQIVKALGIPAMQSGNTERFVMTVSSENDFVDNLKNILSSQRVQQVVSSLLSQVSFKEAEIPYR